MDTKELVNYLYRLSDGKHKLMEDLLKVTKDQAEAIEKTDMDRLNETIGKKDKIIESIDKLDREFVEKYQRLKEILGIEDLSKEENEPVEGFKELKSKVNNIMESIKELKEIDNENIKKIENNMKEVKSNLKGARTGKKAVGSYNKRYKESQSIFIDKKN